VIVPHAVRVPLHVVVHEQPACAAQVCWVPNVVHVVGVPVQVLPVHVQPDCAVQSAWVVYKG
jgi:hypothetical protein